MDKFTFQAELFYKLITKTATLDEIETARILFEEDPTAKAEWDHLQQQLNRPDVQAHFAAIDSEKSFQKFEAEVMGTPKPARRMLRKRWLQVAAVILPLAIATGWYLTRQTTTSPATFTTEITIQIGENGQHLALPDSGTIDVNGSIIRSQVGGSAIEAAAAGSSDLNTLSVPAVKEYSLKLSDGTLVRLNAKSKLKFPFNFKGAGSREVYVEGEGYFVVATNPDQPFIVHTAGATVTVLGTSFNINTYRALTISLEKGAVSVTTPQQTLKLAPGQQAVLDKPGDSLQVVPFDPYFDLSWLSGARVFDNLSLRELIDEMDRQYGVTVIVDSPQAYNRYYHGSINPKLPVSHFLKSLNMLGGWHFEMGKDSIIHVR